MIKFNGKRKGCGKMKRTDSVSGGFTVWIKTDLVVLLVGLLYYSVLFITGETCLIKAVTGKDCPCCRMTRAMVRLFKGDFSGYFNENFMVCFYMQLHFNKGKIKKAVDAVTVFVAAITFIKYLFI